MSLLTPSRRPGLSLEPLEHRDVPAATLGLTTAGSAGQVNGALFQQTDAQPTGTGVISSFVRVQANGGERGYNTDARPLQLNENASRKFTRSLRLDDVPVAIVGGVTYRQFLLDINQTAANPLLSLDELKIYLGDRGDLTGYEATTGKLAGLDAVYDLDGGGDSAVLLNYSLNHGSGSGDAVVMIPDAAFAAPTANPYVYLYSVFGQTAGANAGFEEWSVLPRSDVSALGGLSGTVYFDVDQDGTRNGGDYGIPGVYVTLTGTDDRGQFVSLTTVTSELGAYSFAGLRPGVYNLTETQPDGYLDGSETLGSLGGTVGADMFTSIYVGANQFGTGYNFGEININNGDPN